ncbi:MAG: flagellar hook-basal body complex protein, partial [Alphaproteobacteria bacterium]
MSIYGAMFSGVSALFANSQALGMISDNISNVNTIGYKATRSRFATLVTSQANPNSYSPGGVSSKPQSLVDQQGLLQASASGTDIAISGRGFFIVNDSVDATADQATGSFMFTRAGSFSPDSNGYLRNTGGFYLMGWPTNNNGAIDLNGDGLSNSSDTVQRGALVETELRPVKVTSLIGSAAATSSAGIDANLPSTAAVGDQHVVTVQVFDSLGNGNNVNLTFTKSATNEWNITAPPPANAGTLSLTNSAGAVYHASGRLDFTANAAPGETIDIDGTTYSFVAGAPVGNQIQVGANLAATLTNIAAVDARITSDGVSTLNIIQSGTTAMTIDAFTGGLAAKIEQTAGITVSGLMAGTIAPAVVFDGNGVPTSFNVANMSIGGYSSGASNSAIAIDLGNTGGPSGLTQFASSFTVGSITQNGSRFGNFQGAL